jgi:hypothetical protein
VSVSLYSMPEVYHSSWVEMKPTVTMRYEVDRDNELATLYFGHNDQYVLTLSRENLDRFLDLATAARGELNAT